jgi:hypothetical protein
VPKLFFQPARWLEDEEYEVTVAKGASVEAKNAVTVTFSKSEKPLALEGKKPNLPKLKPMAEEEAEVDEPEKRKPAVKANAVPQKKAGSLAATVSEWDDE